MYNYSLFDTDIELLFSPFSYRAKQKTGRSILHMEMIDLKTRLILGLRKGPRYLHGLEGREDRSILLRPKYIQSNADIRGLSSPSRPQYKTTFLDAFKPFLPLIETLSGHGFVGFGMATSPKEGSSQGWGYV